MDRKSSRLRFGTLLFALALPAGLAPAHADGAKKEVVVPSSSAYPEGLTATADGTLYISSMTNGGVARVEPGAAEAEAWIAPGAFETRSTFGVLADEQAGKLWVCSNDATPLGVTGPTRTEGAHVKRFDLKTGAGDFSVRLPSSPSLCNDLVIGPDGALYVTNTLQPEILRLEEGASELEVWVRDETLAGGLDGLAFGPDGNLYVNTFMSGQLFRIDVSDGMPGAITKLELSRPLRFPDGLKSDGSGFLLVEGAGPLSTVRIEGDAATIETLEEFTGPSGVTRVGDTVWVSEGQITSLMDPNRTGDIPEFRLKSVELPTR